MRFDQVRGRLRTYTVSNLDGESSTVRETEWHNIPTAEESVCEHGETICDNCVNMGWSDDWELQGFPAWGAVDETQFPDPRR